MKNTYKILMLAVLLGAFGLISACQSTDVDKIKVVDTSYVGKPVQFSLGTEMEIETRTVYTGDGEFVGSKLVKERIDWVVGDMIRVYCANTHTQGDPDKHYADYLVKEVVQDEATVSTAVLVPTVEEDFLVWDLASEYDFYAVYPSPAANEGVVFNPEKGVVSASLPAEQTLTARSGNAMDYQPDMNTSYMVANNKVIYDPRNFQVDLSFQPVVTPFEFVVGRGDNEKIAISSFTLTSLGDENLTGEFTVPYATCAKPSTYTMSAEGSKVIKTKFVSASGSGMSAIVVGEDPLRFTLLTLPQAYKNGIQVEFKTTTGSTCTMTLKQSGETMQFEACAKSLVALNMPHDDSPEAEVGGVLYKTLGEALAVAQASASDCVVKLYRGCEAMDTLVFSGADGAGAVTLDLNGKTLATAYPIRVREGRKLTITDSSSDNPVLQGKINFTYDKGQSILVTDATVNIEGGNINTLSETASYYSVYYTGTSTGAISGGVITNKNYTAVYIASKASLDLNGTAAIYGSVNYTIYNSGELKVSGSPLIHSTGYSETYIRAAIYSVSGSKTYITGTPHIVSTKSYGIYTNGLLTDIDMDGTVESESHGIYITGGNEANIKGGFTVTTNTGRCIYVTGSTPAHISGNFTATSTGSQASFFTGGAIVDLSGDFTMNADEFAAFYNYNATVTINGGHFVSNKSNAFYNYNGGYTSNKPVTHVYGGTFETLEGASYAMAASGSSVTVDIHGGNFRSAAKNMISPTFSGKLTVDGGNFNAGLIAPACKDQEGNDYVNILNDDPDTKDNYPFTVVKKSDAGHVANVTASSYIAPHGTMASAIEDSRTWSAALRASKIELTDDVAYNSTIAIQSGNKYMVTLDMKGYKLSSNATPAVLASSGLTIQDTSTDADGEITTTGSDALIVTGGTTTVNSVTLVGSSAAVNVSGGALVASSGYYYGGTADVTVSSGSATLTGGFYKNEPASTLIGDGCKSKEEAVTYGGRDYAWKVIVDKPVIHVDGVNYVSMAEAEAAVKAYTGTAEVINVVLYDDVAFTAQVTFAGAPKPIVLDLNGHTLSTTLQQAIYISTGVTLTITDSATTKGKYTSSETQMVRTAGTSTFTATNCVIECTKDKSAAWNNDPIYYIIGSSVVNFNNAKTVATRQVTCMYQNNTTTTVNITDSEFTSGAESGQYGYYGLVINAGTMNFNSGSIYINAESSEQYSAVHSAGSNATININGGYFFSNGTRVLSRSYGKLNINGGYMNQAPATSATIGDGKSLVSTVVTHTHATTGDVLTYTYVVE